MNEKINAICELLNKLPEGVQDTLLTLAEGAVYAVEHLEDKKTA